MLANWLAICAQRCTIHCLISLTLLYCLSLNQVGEGEKLVKALFALARELQPAIIFLGQHLLWSLCLSWGVVLSYVRAILGSG